MFHVKHTDLVYGGENSSKGKEGKMLRVQALALILFQPLFGGGRVDREKRERQGEALSSVATDAPYLNEASLA